MGIGMEKGEERYAARTRENEMARESGRCNEVMRDVSLIDLLHMRRISIRHLPLWRKYTS